jgi:hypothetical protein
MLAQTPAGNDARSQRAVFPTKKLAGQALNKMIGSLNDGTYVKASGNVCSKYASVGRSVRQSAGSLLNRNPAEFAAHQRSGARRC